MRFSGLLRLLALPFRFVRSLVALLVGSVHVQWSPPRWVRPLGRHRLAAALILLVVLGSSYGIASWYRAHLADRARPRALVAERKVKATVQPPAVPGWDKAAQRITASPLIVTFDTDAAPLDVINKPEAPAVADLSPATKGRWTWTTAREARFQPEQPFPAGTTFRLSFRTDGFAAHTLPDPSAAEVTTRALEVKAEKPVFTTDPSEPANHRAMVTLEFNQPILRADLAQHLRIQAISGAQLFRDGAPEIHSAPDSSTRFHVGSPLVTIPDNEDFARFLVPKGFTAASGGRGLAEEFAVKVAVPTRTTGLQISAARAELVPDANGEPQQFVFLETSRAVGWAELPKHVQVWALPEDHSEPWTALTVTDAVLAASTAIPLELVRDESAAPHSTTFGFRLKPRAPATLWVRVNSGLPGFGGFALAQTFAQAVRLPAFPKEVDILGEGGVLALTGDRKLSIKSRGLDHLRFTLGRVPASRVNHLVSQTRGNFQAPEFRGWSFGVADLARLQRTVTPIARRNDHEANYSALDLGPELNRGLAGDADPAKGLFFLEAEGVRPRTDEDEPAKDTDPDPKWIALGSDGEQGDDEEGEVNGMQRRFILVTDLGLVVKRAADGTREVFVMSFAKRAPVADAEVTVLARNGEPLATTRTDPQGRASLPALDGHQREKKATAILTRLGDDLSFIPWARDDREVDLSRFAIDGVPTSEVGKLDAFLFTERGIYRPGDRIQVGAVVRRRDWQGSLDGLPLNFALHNATGQTVAELPVPLRADGFVEVALPTTESAPTGVWTITLNHPDKEEHIAAIRVRVEDFQPDRLKLAARLNRTTVGWLSPEDLAANLELHTLFDLPAADRRITAKLRLAPARPQFAEWKGWNFHLPEAEGFESREIELEERRTDATGKATVPLALQAYSAPLLQVGLALEAFEADGGRGVQAGVSALVSPHAELLAWKAEGDLAFVPRDVTTRAKVVAVGRDLKPVAVTGLARVLLETRQVSVLTRDGDGKLAYVSQGRDHEVERVAMDLPAGETAFDLPVAKAGRFRYEWRNAKGTVLCSVPFNVVGPGELTRGLQRDAELELAIPKREWRPGDVMEVSIRAPYAGAGLITIERERVLAHYWFDSPTASTVQKITVPEGLEGGAHVHVAFVRRMDAPEIFTNPLSVGVVPFTVSKDARRLPVEVEAPALVRPGTTMAMRVRTPKPSRIAVWAVDDGIHRVTRYQLPNPLTAFFRPPMLEVSTWQLLDLLLPEFTLVKQTSAYGGDGDENALEMGLNPFKRKRNAPVVYWSGIIDCGPDGRELRYDVPDYFAGRLNIMAVAVSADTLGSAEANTIVKGAFVLTPNVPLFAAPGDEFFASLTVANQSEPAVETVTLGATTNDALEIVEAPAAETKISPNTEATVRFRVRAKSVLGNAEIRFAAAAGEQRAVLASTLSVRPATPPVSRIESGWFREATHEVAVGQPLHREFARREAAVSATPMGLGNGLSSYLREFPHGCTEQTTSKAFPYLLTKEEAPFAPSRAEAEAAIAHACRVLVSRQMSDGGFGYWTRQDGSGALDPLAVYVGHFLDAAQTSGFAIPPALQQQTGRKLQAMASLPVKTREEANLQAAAIYLLTRRNEKTTNYALNLTDTLRRTHGSAWHRDVSAAWLAGTWMLLKMEKEGKDLLATHLQALKKPDDRKVTPFYESPLANAAQSFTVLCRHFPEAASKLDYDDLRPITEPIQRGQFHTHSAAWTILALKGYFAQAKASGIQVGMRQQLAGAWLDFSGGSFDPTATKIQFHRNAGANAVNLGAWYQTVEFGFPREVPTRPETRGVEVFREFRDRDGKAVSEAKVGEDLTVTLRVRNVNAGRIDHLAVVDLLPAGFENAPNDLRPGLGALPGTTYVDVREDRNLIFLHLGPGESRSFQWKVRPTCAGKFTIPPAFGEAMYDRAISGLGAGGSISILPR